MDWGTHAKELREALKILRKIEEDRKQKEGGIGTISDP